MKKRTKEILDILDSQFGTEYKCYLNYETPWQLLAATMLSAQCTDARVNIVTKDLFQKYTSPGAIAAADLKELEEDIRPTGFYHNKAKNLIACMRDIHEKYGDEVPSACDPGEYLSCPECGGGHPCEADFREAGIYEAGGSGKDRKGSDEGTSERPLDSLQYSDHPVWEDDLHGEKPKVWGLFLAKVL